ncbi:MAG TPA: EAL domain-containing protein [Solirubrobacteraceae bacterium]|jgi:diguanylate cyclase (GGDEF)-like protein
MLGRPALAGEESHVATFRHEGMDAALAAAPKPVEDLGALDPESEQEAAKAVASDPHLLRARRTAATTRAVLGLLGAILVLRNEQLATHPREVVLGFIAISFSAMVQLLLPRLSWAQGEEAIAGGAAILIVGLQSEHVTVVSLVWLAAIASGMLSRNGRVHWIGRAMVLLAFALPILRFREVGNGYIALCITAMGLLITSRRLTRELNRLMLEARYDADHDDLTGLLSRAAFKGALERAVTHASSSEPVCLLLVDLDGFGQVNKTLGHTAGDALLASVAAALAEYAGPRCRVGRLGGDEFAVLARVENPEELAQRLLKGLGGCGSDTQGVVSACIGVAQAPTDGDDCEALLMAVDIALRGAKRGGKRAQIVSYDGESLSGVGERSARYALAKLVEGKGVAMAVQPIVHLRTGKIHAYEALARFGTGSMQSPLHWFSLADELGQRAALERACLHEALKLLSSRPLETRISVNLSAPVLLDKRTLAMLERVRDLSGLIVEVTEQALVASDVQLADAFAPLRAKGACLAVDDMGAGYSGLRQVTVVHPHYLKLDRSLVEGIDGDPDRAALVGALIGYAERVGSLLVAEGIEYEAELQTLLQLGVPLGQGFYLSRPVAPWPAFALEDSAMLTPIMASADQRVGERRVQDRRAEDREPALDGDASLPQPLSGAGSKLV